MLEMDDNQLIAMSLREHAQTCDDIAEKYAAKSDGRIAWKRRADRCRELAACYASASPSKTPERGRA